MAKFVRLYFPMLVLATIMLATSACGSRTSPTPTLEEPTQTVPADTPTPFPQPPDGSYTASITKDDATGAGLSSQLACENAGTLRFTIKGDRWSVLQTPAPDCTVMNPSFSGSWTFSGPLVTFHDDVPDPDPNCPNDYKYKWDFDGTELRFTPVEDRCPPRVVCPL